MANDRRLTLSPAYGRDYKSSTDVFQDWITNYDFVIKTPGYHTYINRSDAERYGIPGGRDTIKIRYNHLVDSILVIYNQITQEWRIQDGDLEFNNRIFAE